MNKTTAAISTVLLVLGSTSAFAQAKVAVAHFAPFADTIEGTAVNISVNGTPVEALQGVVPETQQQQYSCLARIFAGKGVSCF